MELTLIYAATATPHAAAKATVWQALVQRVAVPVVGPGDAPLASCARQQQLLSCALDFQEFSYELPCF